MKIIIFLLLIISPVSFSFAEGRTKNPHFDEPVLSKQTSSDNKENIILDPNGDPIEPSKSDFANTIRNSPKPLNKSVKCELGDELAKVSNALEPIVIKSWLNARNRDTSNKAGLELIRVEYDSCDNITVTQFNDDGSVLYDLNFYFVDVYLTFILNGKEIKDRFVGKLSLATGQYDRLNNH